MRERPDQVVRAPAPERARLNDADFGGLLKAQEELWRGFLYRPDVEERWQGPRLLRPRLLAGCWRRRLVGDCEDFALELRAALRGIVPPGAMRFVQCWNVRGEPHLVLAIDDIERGTLILDNRRPCVHWRRHESHGTRFRGGVTEVHGRGAWAWNLRAPSLAELLTLNRKPT